MNPRFLALALLLGCSPATTATVDPATIANAIVTCTRTTCGAANTSPACVALEADVLACLAGAATGNPAACLATVPAAISTGYADLVCVLADLAAPSPAASPAIQSAPGTASVAAARVLAAQGVLVRKGGP